MLALGGNVGAGLFATIDLAEARRPFEDKVFAHFATAQAALPFLAKDGSLTFVSAVSGQAAMPGTAALGAANAAIAALAPILAVELKPLRVNAVSPGVIDTPWWSFRSRRRQGRAVRRLRRQDAGRPDRDGRGRRRRDRLRDRQPLHDRGDDHLRRRRAADQLGVNAAGAGRGTGRLA